MAEPKAGERPAALESFVAALKRLREDAGAPSFRRMAQKSGAVSHATLHLTVTGHRLQPWETVREFVRACDGDEREWQVRWQNTEQALSDEESPDPDGATPADTTPQPRRRPKWLIAAAGVGVAVLCALAGVWVFDGEEPTGAAQESPATGPVHPGDASEFIGDVTVPDGTVLGPGSEFVKVWKIRNEGSVAWRDRFLQRDDLPVESTECQTADRIPITDTPPGQPVDIAVTVTTPSSAPADCTVKWKMVDESGRQLFPGSRPIYFQVHVRR
ncbi:hypothetical protein CFN78_00045 [Amycolatopsis antarctica]|uniref:Nbr1 FW domain-containing protein n=1 Tax=Amycolatopsis antarctica TaxID=1854586 RepID=A0A263D8G9_9PSEU|nr:NBR1-Ig-like domain-containing protein [Amycolatopsis antarctica]OZM74681.1 hypothetical protein CFN78_00045 [Amycolatopsis antarctica]